MIKYLYVLAIWCIGIGAAGVEAKGSTIAEFRSVAGDHGIYSVSYQFDGQPRQFHSAESDARRFVRKFTLMLTGKILDALYVRYGEPAMDNRALQKICAAHIKFSSEQTAVVQKTLPYFSAVATGIVQMHEQKLSAEEAYRQYLSSAGVVDEKNWQLDSKQYGYDWAKQFLQYSVEEQINSMLYERIISVVKGLVLREKIRKALDVEPGQEGAAGKIQKWTSDRVDELQIQLPEEVASSEAEAVNRIAGLLSGRASVPEGWQPILDALNAVGETFSLAQYRNDLIENHVSSKLNDLTEPVAAYSLRIVGDAGLTASLKAPDAVPREALDGFMAWTKRIVRQDRIAEIMPAEIAAFPDVPLFARQTPDGVTFFTWRSDILFFEHREKPPRYALWDTGSFYVFLLKDQAEPPSAEDGIKEYIGNLIPAYFNLTGREVLAGRLTAQYRNRVWSGRFELAGEEAKSWKSEVEFVVGRDFVAFFFWEVDPARSPRSTPGDLDRF
jgi:hypothetical protein